MSPRRVLGTCHHDCPDSCGWIANVEDGRAVKLRGNPEHPFSAGELCPKVNRFRLALLMARTRNSIVRAARRASKASRSAKPRVVLPRKSLGRTAMMATAKIPIQRLKSSLPRK